MKPNSTPRSKLLLKLLYLVSLALLPTSCISESDNANCTGDGEGDPGSGVDLQLNAVTIEIDATDATFRAVYWNAGSAEATSPALPDGSLERIQLALYFDSAACPPTGEASTYTTNLPQTVPAGAVAEAGISAPLSEFSVGEHTVFTRVDAYNATWEADEFNNCYGPTTLTVP